MPLDPARDGFAFGNFAASDTEAVFDVGDLQSMFGAGVDVCLYGDAEPCEPTAEAAAFARMVNLARSGGHCEGLVVRVAELFDQSPPTATSSLANSGEVTHGIIRRFATQLFADVRADAAQWAGKDLSSIVAALETSFAQGELSHTMGLYTQAGGHSVLPYGLTWLTDTTARVSVYDPNWPGQRRHVDIDIDSNRWTFSFAGIDPGADRSPWIGGAGSMDLVSLASREIRRCPFCGDGPESAPSGSVMLVRSAGSDWAVRTRSGVLTAGVGADVAGAVRPIRAGGTTVRDHLVDLTEPVFADAAATVNIELGSPARVAMLLPTGVVEVQVVETTRPVTISVTSDSVSTAGGESQVTVSRGFLGLTVTGTDVALRHSTNAMSASFTAGGVRRRSAVNTVSKVNDPSLTAVSAELPEVLVRTTDFPRLVPGPLVTAPPQLATQPTEAPEERGPARVTFDLSGWQPAEEDPVSYGFVAGDVIGGDRNETQECRSIACLRRKTVWVPRGGYDPTTDTVLLSPYEFTMTGLAVPVEVRCGHRARWRTAEPDGSGYSVSCRIGNVTGDATVSVRTP